ncbi:Uu.00g101270.m01.CDS01 [Anthostomella pinea]|uniref:Uu.00g101270.m01.CDS01 n=1 Tax=Anthostomella pinea TaxID=933095 RepID=A0AAI8VDN7_9PEZI|nr:Uu.00g101270.m01.CDS01 [Anthostomella pinea]
MNRTLEGKLAIVTGASRGIGEAIARKLASYGANIALCYTSPSSESKTEALAKDLEAAHSIKTVVLQADLSTTDGPQALITALQIATDGTPQIDILINNAGVAHNALLPSVNPEQFDISYRTNVLGPLLLTQAAEPWLPHDRSGRIVNISSVSSATGFIEQSVYGGTKAALEAMTRTWARELSERCTVNAVNPGPVAGPMYAANTDAFKQEIRGWIEHTPLMRAREGVDDDAVVEEARTAAGGGRPAYVQEIAGIVAMLCGEDAAWCTGQVVCANGGMIMH